MRRAQQQHHQTGLSFRETWPQKYSTRWEPWTWWWVLSTCALFGGASAWTLSCGGPSTRALAPPSATFIAAISASCAAVPSTAVAVTWKTFILSTLLPMISSTTLLIGNIFILLITNVLICWCCWIELHAWILNYLCGTNIVVNLLLLLHN